jgi:dihydrolipoamide dehydrogenase
MEEFFMKAKIDYDLAVIGGGPGGYVAAIRAAQFGLKVALVEERELGGTCLNRGCIPAKSLLHTAEVYHTVQHCAEFGITAREIGFDFAQIAAKKDGVIRQLRGGVESLVKSNGVTVINGRGVIKDPNTVTVEIPGETPQIIQTAKIIIATGSRPLQPPIPGIDGDRVITSDGVMQLTNCPEQVVIIGGGVIGVEIGTVFNSLGKAVTIIEMMDNILPGIDTEITQLLRKSLEARGVKIFTDSKVIGLKSVAAKATCTFKSSGKTLEAEGDLVIVAIGRRPNTENLGLEKAGIAMERVFIKVDKRLETSVSGIYAIGDVVGKVQLAHVASAQGMVAAANAAGKNKKMEYKIVPGCIYTSPEIAMVGLTETAAIQQGYQIAIGKFPIASNGKSLIMGVREGLIKVVADKSTGEILGAQIMGPRATDLIAEIGVAMKLESTIEELADTIHPHPTVSEIVMEAAHDVAEVCIHKPRRSHF